MKNKNLLLKIWDYLKVRKKWWLLPLIILLILAGALIIAISPALSPFIPFIYPLG